MRRVEYPYWPTYRVASSGEVARAMGLLNPVIVADTVLLEVLMTDTEPDEWFAAKTLSPAVDTATS
jgi:hypothetical protein